MPLPGAAQYHTWPADSASAPKLLMPSAEGCATRITSSGLLLPRRLLNSAVDWSRRPAAARLGCGGITKKPPEARWRSSHSPGTQTSPGCARRQTGSSVRSSLAAPGAHHQNQRNVRRSKGNCSLSPYTERRYSAHRPSSDSTMPSLPSQREDRRRASSLRLQLTFTTFGWRDALRTLAQANGSPCRRIPAARGVCT